MNMFTSSWLPLKSILKIGHSEKLFHTKLHKIKHVVSDIRLQYEDIQSHDAKLFGVYLDLIQSLKDLYIEVNADEDCPTECRQHSM